MNSSLIHGRGKARLPRLPFGGKSTRTAQSAAEAARCAGEQGSFWEYHDALYAEQSKMDGAELLTRGPVFIWMRNRFKSCNQQPRQSQNPISRHRTGT